MASTPLALCAGDPGFDFWGEALPDLFGDLSPDNLLVGREPFSGVPFLEEAADTCWDDATELDREE